MKYNIIKNINNAVTTKTKIYNSSSMNFDSETVLIKKK